MMPANAYTRYVCRFTLAVAPCCLAEAACNVHTAAALQQLCLSGSVSLAVLLQEDADCRQSELPSLLKAFCNCALL